MKILNKYDHMHAMEILSSKLYMFEEIEDMLNDSKILFERHKSQNINKLVASKFNNKGWADRVRIQNDSNLTINYIKNRIGVCFQIGNVARTYADILKIAYLIDSDKIDVGIIIVPDKKESILMGANYANFQRLSRELVIFKDIIHFPILLLSLAN